MARALVLNEGFAPGTSPPRDAQNAESVRRLRSEFDGVHGRLDQLAEALPVLEARCRTFLDAITRIGEARKANSLVLQYHPQLLELLELPQLMETCVRNGYFEEALELEAHVAQLRYALDDSPILASIVRGAARARARHGRRWPDMRTAPVACTALHDGRPRMWPSRHSSCSRS